MLGAFVARRDQTCRHHVDRKPVARSEPRLMNSRTVGLTVAVCALAVMPSCKDGMPSSREVRAYKLDKFIVDESNLRGVYVNYDVDSLVFTYTTSQDDFWSTLQSRLADTKWKQIDQTDVIHRYERITPRNGKLGSSEEIRIAYRPHDRLVVVAWVQADTEESFADTSEGHWAQGVIWPKFESLLQ